MTRLVRSAAALLLLVAVAFVVPAHASPPISDAADAVVAYDRDVFVIVGSTLRNPDETTAADAPLFNNAGVGLERTWGEWGAATATSEMVERGKRTVTDLTFTGLVPGGVYSVFYGTLGPDSENPLCPDVERALPLTSKDKHQSPDAASFVATADGTASFVSRLDATPLDAQQVFVELVYHFDGKTYGSLPNAGEFQTQGPNCRSSFGEDAMRQLLILQQW